MKHKSINTAHDSAGHEILQSHDDDFGVPNDIGGLFGPDSRLSGPAFGQVGTSRESNPSRPYNLGFADINLQQLSHECRARLAGSNRRPRVADLGERHHLRSHLLGSGGG